MEDRPLTAALLKARAKFNELQHFVTLSAAQRPLGDQSFRENLYTSWVLLTYATLQSSIADHGAACVELIGRAALHPNDLPAPLLREHRKQTLAYLADYAAGRLSSGTEKEFDQTLATFQGTDWSRYSRLMAVERNVWPDYVRAWLRRLSPDHKLGWFDAPAGGSSETLRSQVEGLVDERNRLAHGERPLRTVDARIMSDWIDSASLFAERVARTLQEWVVETFADLSYAPLGDLEAEVSAKLSSTTVAYSRLSVGLAVGEMVCIRQAAHVHLVPIASLQRDGVALEEVAERTERVAVAFSHAIPEGSTIHCLP